MQARAVLVADDSATVRALVRLELEEAGYLVHEAHDGAAAVELAGRTPLDVVLLDLEMPVLDGYGALSALKADPRTADLPVVFLTGSQDSKDVVRALDAGAHDYLSKPPVPAELLARVAAAVRVKALQDELRARVDELDAISRTDVLTGLHNRRHMQEHLRGLQAGARRHAYPLAVLLLDIDRFKAVNDTHGHPAGDVVLQAVSACLQEQLRAEDLVGRWGGEEFLVVLPQSGAAAARVLGERLRRSVADLRIPFEGVLLEVTTSVGGAALERDGDEDLLTAADRELYAAKEAGRDRVHVAGAP